MVKTRVIHSINDLSTADWDAVFTGGRACGNPFVRHAFLSALEDSGCVGGNSGWQPCHVVLEDEQGLRAAAVSYQKQHSYGEFVFDWSWAQAYERHGLAYYPKLITAIPFTPSLGPRLGVRPGLDRKSEQSQLLQAVLDYASEQQLSSWHLLFPDTSPPSPDGSDLLPRKDVQFHWRNQNYSGFDDFLAGLKSSRRKTLKRERVRVREHGVVMERHSGSDIRDQDWDGFYRCYVATYLKRSGHGGYLNREFFELLRERMPEQLMLVVARREQRMVAGALFLFGADRLFGRYWGALESIPCLHFEACFYQGIEFAIEHGLQVFDPGTQGEHKLLRGFEPVETRSWHWIRDSRFRLAIADYLEQERRMTGEYGKQAARLLPFRQGEAPGATGSDASGQSLIGDGLQRTPGGRNTS